MELFDKIKKERQLIAFKAARLLLTQIVFLKAYKRDIMQDDLMHIKRTQSNQVDYLYFTYDREEWQIWQDNNEKDITVRVSDDDDFLITEFKLDFENMDMQDAETVMEACHVIYMKVIAKNPLLYQSFCDSLVFSDILPPQLLEFDGMDSFIDNIERLDIVTIADKYIAMVVDVEDLLVADILSIIGADLKTSYLLPNYCTLTCSDSDIDNGVYHMIFCEPSLERETLFTMAVKDGSSKVFDIIFNYDNGKQIALYGGWACDDKIKVLQKIKAHISDKSAIVREVQ